MQRKCKIDNRISLVFIILLAFILRLLGFNWGLSFGSSFPAEINTYRPALDMISRKSVISYGIVYPTQITQKVLAVLYCLYNFIRIRLCSFEADEMHYIYIARCLMAFWSTCQVFVVYKLGNKLYENSGIWAALLTALFAPFIYSGHELMGEPLQTTMLCAALLAGTYYLDEKDKRKALLYIALMSAASGCAMIEKWNGAAGMGVVAFSILFKHRDSFKHWIKRVFCEGVVALVSFVGISFLIAPNIYIFPVNTYYWIKAVAEAPSNIQNPIWNNLKIYAGGFGYYAGIIAVVLSLTGVAALALMRRKQLLLFTIAPIMFCGMSIQNRAYVRWMFAAYAVLIIAVGVGIRFLMDKCHKPVFKVLLGVGMSIMILNIGLCGVEKTVQYVKKDAYYQNKSHAWFLERGMDETDCLYDRYTCWNSGAYTHIVTEMDSMEQHLLQENGTWYCDKLGRTYAVSNNASPKAFDGAIPLAEQIGQTYLGLGFAGNSERAYTCCDVINIVNRVKNIYEIMADRLTVSAYMASIYDISEVPAYEEFVFENFEEQLSGDTYVYSTPVTSIYEGEYVVTIYAEKNMPAIEISVGNGEGTEPARCKLENGEGTLVVSFKVKRGTIELLSDQPIAFEKLRIETKSNEHH